MLDGASVSTVKGQTQWDASLPVSMDHKASPSLGPFLPLLPSVPATPRMGSSTVPATPHMGSQAPATTDQNRAHLHQWQNKMHAQFRRAMLGDNTAAALYVGLPPLPQVNGHQDSPSSKISSEDVSKPHAQLQPSPSPNWALPLGLRQTNDLMPIPSMAPIPVINASPFAPVGGGLRLDTSQEALLPRSPRSPALSGVSSPGSAPASPYRNFASPPASQYRNFASPNEKLACSPGVDSPGSWHAGNESLRPNDVINKSSDTTAAEDVFGPGCFSCFACFGRTEQLDRSRVLETSTSSPGSAHTSASRMRLGIVIVHFDDVKDLAKKSHVVFGLAPGGAAQRSGLIHVGDNILSINHDSLAHVGNEAVKRKFEEAQRENDSVKLTVLRGGKELKLKVHLLASHYEGNAQQHARSSSRGHSPSRSRNGDVYTFPHMNPARANVAMNGTGVPMDNRMVVQGDPLGRWPSPALNRNAGWPMFMGGPIGSVGQTPSTQMSSRAPTSSNARTRQQSPSPNSGRAASGNGSQESSPKQRRRTDDKSRRKNVGKQKEETPRKSR